MKQLNDIQPGESVIIAEKSWTVLDDVGNGILCLMDYTLSNKVFDDSEYINNWSESTLRKELNSIFLEEIKNKLGQEPIKTMVDLTTDDGLTDYGCCEDKVFLLSANQYRKYRRLIKEINDSWWLITADSTRDQFVRYVNTDGSLYDYSSNYINGVRPACVFPYSTYVENINYNKNIFVIGSMSQAEQIKSIAKRYNNSKYVYHQPSKSFEELVNECFDNIENCDIVIALRKPDGTIGEGTTYEIEYAKRLGKEIIFFD